MHLLVVEFLEFSILTFMSSAKRETFPFQPFSLIALASIQVFRLDMLTLLLILGENNSIFTSNSIQIQIQFKFNIAPLTVGVGFFSYKCIVSNEEVPFYSEISGLSFLKNHE